MPETKRIACQIVIHAPIERVWKALTEEGVVLPHFFGSVMHTAGLHPGSPLRMRTPDDKYTGVVGEILEVEAPHRFAHTFRFTHLDDPECRVIYELKATAEGTELTLISDAVPSGTKTEKSMQQGSTFITEVLKGQLEKGRPPFKYRLILRMIRLLAFTTPAKCRSEHWPLPTTHSTP